MDGEARMTVAASSMPKLPLYQAFRAPIIIPSAAEDIKTVGGILPGLSLGIVGAACGINVTFPFLASLQYLYVRGTSPRAHLGDAAKLAGKIYIPQVLGKIGQYVGSVGLITVLDMISPSTTFLNQPAGFASVAVVAQQLLYKQVVDRTITDVLKEKSVGTGGFFGSNDFGKLWKQGKALEAVSSLRHKPAIPGFLPAFAREFGALGMSFHTGAWINNWAREHFGSGGLVAFGSGCAAGALGAVLTQPLQVLAMLQTGHVKQHGHTMSYSVLFKQHVQKFGVGGLWNGIAMRFIVNSLVAGNNILFLNDHLQQYFKIMRGHVE